MKTNTGEPPDPLDVTMNLLNARSVMVANALIRRIEKVQFLREQDLYRIYESLQRLLPMDEDTFKANAAATLEGLAE